MIFKSDKNIFNSDDIATLVTDSVLIFYSIYARLNEEVREKYRLFFLDQVVNPNKTIVKSMEDKL